MKFKVNTKLINKKNKQRANAESADKSRQYLLDDEEEDLNF